MPSKLGGTRKPFLKEGLDPKNFKNIFCVCVYLLFDGRLTAFSGAPSPREIWGAGERKGFFAPLFFAGRIFSYMEET